MTPPLRWLGALCFGLFLLYLPTLGQGFHFDDHHMVVENQFIKDWSHFPQMLLTPSISSAPVAKGMYRPVLMLSYAWNYQTGGLNPIGYHLVNVWLHLLVTCFIVALGLRLWPEISPRWILLGTALWATHPLQTQAVAYVASRSSVLATFWMALALWLYGTKGRYWFSLAAYGLALGSKEIAVTLPGLLLLYEFHATGPAAGRPSGAPPPGVDPPLRGIPAPPVAGISRVPYKIPIRLTPFLILTGAYLLWRKHLIGAVGVVYPLRPWPENFRMQLEGILTYLRLWVWPVNQSIVHPQPTGQGTWPWISLGLLAALAWAGWRGAKRMPGLTFALAWAAITFLPIAFTSSLNLIVSEHHAYLPTVGFALGLPQVLSVIARSVATKQSRFKNEIAASAFGGLAMTGRVVVVVIFVLIGMLSIATFRRVLVWRDNFVLWADAAAQTPASSMVQNNLGLEYEMRGQLEEALQGYLHALRLARSPIEEATARNNLGNLYVRVKEPEMALGQFERCLELNRFERGLTYNNIGLAFRDLGAPEKAEEAYTKALEADPRLIEGYLNLGGLWFLQGRRREAGQLFEQAVRLDPDHPVSSMVLGKFYFSEKQFTRALPVFQHLVTLIPNRPEGYLYSAISALRINPPRLAQARVYLNRAAALGWRPDPILLAELEGGEAGRGK